MGLGTSVDRTPRPLADWRRMRGWSPTALAARAAVGESTVRRIERGTTRPKPCVARRLAAALGTDSASVAGLAEAVPSLGPERAYLAPRRDRAGARLDEEQFPAVSVVQERAHVGLEAGVVGGDAREAAE